MQVGWLGLGAMGAPMAARAARAGHVVRGYDVVPGRAASLAGDGVRPADTVAAAVGGADLVVIMVATPGQVEEALFAPGGAAGSLAAGSVVVVMATVGPEAVISVAERFAEGGVAVVDAPVSGGTARAASGDLLVMVSGQQGPVARAQPVLSALARSAPVVGSSPGDGQRMKLVNQLLCGVHIAAAAEALAFAEALGLTAADCWRVLREGAAASFMLDDRGARMVEGQFEPARSALDIFVKDMGLVDVAAGQAGAAAPLAAAARRLYLRGHDLGLGRLDDSVLIDVLRRERGRPAREDDPAHPARYADSPPASRVVRAAAGRSSGPRTPTAGPDSRTLAALIAKARQPCTGGPFAASRTKPRPRTRWRDSRHGRPDPRHARGYAARRPLPRNGHRPFQHVPPLVRPRTNTPLRQRVQYPPY
jgi:3-hydroxyisobutyrate dehydrogenase/putative dehydrogenase